MRQAIQGQALENRMGELLSRKYPSRQWYLDANVGGGVLDIRAIDISMKYGMVIHMTHTAMEMEQRVLKAAGELLERFALSRNKNANNEDSDSLKRRIDGEVVGAATGEYRG